MAQEKVTSDEWRVTNATSNVKHRPPNIIWRIVDLLIGGLFIYAGVVKALDPIRFALDIDNYKILPWSIAVGLAFYLPWLEIFCGLALIFRRIYRGGLSILAALTVIFLIATVAAKARGLDITCGCFGHASQHWSFPQHLAIDLAILAGIVALWVARKTAAPCEAIHLHQDSQS